MYREIKPSNEFSDLIDSFWTFSGNENIEKFKIFPDNCIDLIFEMSQNNAFVSGVMTNFQNQELGVNSDLIGVRFKSEKFGLIVKTPLTEIKNIRIDISKVIPSYESSILEQLINFSSGIDKISFLQRFIFNISNELNKQEDKLILSIANKIRDSRGNIKVGTLANSNYISIRQLERRFKNYVGLTIKQFSNIARFNYAKKIISQHSDKSLLNIAFDVGFFDNSHMTNEFKRISGENPSSFK